MSRRYDAIVVGAGFAGVTAARELGQRGLDVLVLEARDRVGGRTWHDSWDGEPVEMGGMNVHWAEPFLWSELTRYRVSVAESSMMDLAYGLRRADGLEILHRNDALARIDEGLKVFFEGLAPITRPFDVGYRLHPELDALSVSARLDQIELPDDVRGWLLAWLNIVTDGRLGTVSVLHPLKFLSLAGGSFHRALEFFGRFSIVGGTDRVVRSILDDSGAEVRLAEPVTRIDQDADGIAVTTRGGETLEASVGVVATSGNMWSSIDFFPRISPVRRWAGDTGLQSRGTVKVWVAVDGDVPDLYVLRPGTDAANPIASVRKHRVRADGSTALLAWCHDGSVDERDGDLLGRLVLEVFGAPGLNVVSVKAKNWAADPYSRGGITLLRTGLAAYVDDLGAPMGRLVFATADLNQGFQGIDGAIESGILAGREAHSILRRGHPLEGRGPRLPRSALPEPVAPLGGFRSKIAGRR